MFKNVVTTCWSEQAGETVNPVFPPNCCHCMEPATETMNATFDGVELRIPYCPEHIDSAKRYFFGVVRGKKRQIVKKLSYVLSLAAGFLIVFCVLPESDLLQGTDTFGKMIGESFGYNPERQWSFDLNAVPLWIRIIMSLLFSFVMFKTIPGALDKRVLDVGAHDNGYWYNKKVVLLAPGIMDIKINRSSDPAGKTKCRIAFLTPEYAERFRAAQDSKHLAEE